MIRTANIAGYLCREHDTLSAEVLDVLVAAGSLATAVMDAEEHPTAGDAMRVISRANHVMAEAAHVRVRYMAQHAIDCGQLGLPL